jgi:hypothetical protein
MGKNTLAFLKIQEEYTGQMGTRIRITRRRFKETVSITESKSKVCYKTSVREREVK